MAVLMYIWLDVQGNELTKFPFYYSIISLIVPYIAVYRYKLLDKFKNIKIPKNRTKNEGAIRFDLHGFDYPIFNKNKKIPSFEYVPKEGDLVLFPSSLFHSTIPCHSDEQRQMIAFDVRPKN